MENKYTVLEIARYALWVFAVSEKFNIPFEEAQKLIKEENEKYAL